MTTPIGACKCCGGGCCQCWKGSDRSGGGCCYGPGDRVRFTVPRPPVPPGKFGGVSVACNYPCFAPGFPSFAHTYCCGEQGNEPAEEFWVEYEWQEPCVVMEFVDGQQLNPDPTPFFYPPPGSGDPFGGDGTTDPPAGTDLYCHVVHVFVAVEFSASVIAFGDAGGDIGCIFPLEWWYVCSGCKKFPTMSECAVPQDWRPASDQPCGYTGPSGDFYLAAREALGWTFVCDPVQPYPCPWCIGACITGPSTECVTFTHTGGKVYDEFGNPLYCEVDACTNDPCCIVADELDPTCLTYVTFDLSRCDGGKICCHKHQWRRVSCVPSDGYYCADLGIQVCTLTRVDERACVWQNEPTAGCRRRTGSDPSEPIDLPPDCPP